MPNSLLMSIFALFLDRVAILGLSKSDKDLEIIMLRQQVRILQRIMMTTPRICASERMILAALTNKYRHSSDDAHKRIREVMLIFKPDTVLRWHRDMVRWKWTFKRKAKPGKPRISPELETLVVRLARENTRWGYGKIQGELLKPCVIL